MLKHEFEECLRNNIWVTHNLKLVPIKDMSDLHLTNAISMIRRGGRVYGYAEEYYPKLQKEVRRRKLRAMMKALSFS